MINKNTIIYFNKNNLCFVCEHTIKRKGEEIIFYRVKNKLLFPVNADPRCEILIHRECFVDIGGEYQWFRNSTLSQYLCYFCGNQTRENNYIFYDIACFSCFCYSCAAKELGEEFEIVE